MHTFHSVIMFSMYIKPFWNFNLMQKSKCIQICHRPYCKHPQNWTFYKHTHKYWVVLAAFTSVDTSHSENFTWECTLTWRVYVASFLVHILYKKKNKYSTLPFSDWMKPIECACSCLSGSADCWSGIKCVLFSSSFVGWGLKSSSVIETRACVCLNFSIINLTFQNYLSSH